MRRKIKACALVNRGDGHLPFAGDGHAFRATVYYDRNEVILARKHGMEWMRRETKIVPCVVTFDDGKRKRKKAR